MTFEHAKKWRDMGFNLQCSIYCPTFQFRLVGWRKYVRRIPFIGRRLKLKQEQDRIVYLLMEQKLIVCSPENYTLLLQAEAGTSGKE